MAKYDLEQLSLDLVAILQANLGAKLAQISTLKNDGLVLLVPDTARGYFFQSLEKETATNQPVFVFYGLDDPVTKYSSGQATGIEVDLFFILVLQDTAENPVFTRRLLRYMRAFQEVFEENFTKINRSVRISVSSLAPVPLGALDNAGAAGATGVKIRANLA